MAQADPDDWLNTLVPLDQAVDGADPAPDAGDNAWLDSLVPPTEAPAPEAAPTEEPGYFSNLARGVGERGADLVGNVAGFAQTAGDILENEDGVLDWLPSLGGVVDDEQGFRYLNAEEWQQYNKEGGTMALRDLQKSWTETNLGFTSNSEQNWETLKSNPNILKKAQALAAFGLEVGAISLADMAGAVVTPVPYWASRSEEIAQDRAVQDGRPGAPSPEDLAIGGTTAAIITAMERFGAEQVFSAFIKGGSTLKKILKAGVGEAGTEFVQEQMEYGAETLGTKAGEKLSAEQYAMASLERGAQGAVGGGTAGAMLGTPGALMSGPDVDDDIISPDVKPLDFNKDAIDKALFEEANSELFAAGARSREEMAAWENEQLDLQNKEYDLQQKTFPTSGHAVVALRNTNEQANLWPVQLPSGEWVLRVDGVLTLEESAPIEVQEIMPHDPSTELPEIGVTEETLPTEEIEMKRGPIYGGEGREEVPTSEEWEGISREEAETRARAETYPNALRARMALHDLEKKYWGTYLEPVKTKDGWKLLRKSEADMQRLQKESEARDVGLRPTDTPIGVDEGETIDIDSEPAPTTEGIEVEEIQDRGISPVAEGIEVTEEAAEEITMKGNRILTDNRKPPDDDGPDEPGGGGTPVAPDAGDGGAPTGSAEELGRIRDKIKGWSQKNLKLTLRDAGMKQTGTPDQMIDRIVTGREAVETIGKKYGSVREIMDAVDSGEIDRATLFRFTRAITPGTKKTDEMATWQNGRRLSEWLRAAMGEDAPLPMSDTDWAQRRTDKEARKDNRPIEREPRAEAAGELAQVQADLDKIPKNVDITSEDAPDQTELLKKLMKQRQDLQDEVDYGFTKDEAKKERAALRKEGWDRKGDARIHFSGSPSIKEMREQLGKPDSAADELPESFTMYNEMPQEVRDFGAELMVSTEAHESIDEYRVFIYDEVIDKVNVEIEPFGENEKAVELKIIEATEPGNGDGSAALTKILDMADRHGVDIIVNPVASGFVEGGMTQEQLIQWYEANGFGVMDDYDDYMVYKAGADAEFPGTKNGFDEIMEDAEKRGVDPHRPHDGPLFKVGDRVTYDPEVQDPDSLLSPFVGKAGTIETIKSNRGEIGPTAKITFDDSSLKSDNEDFTAYFAVSTLTHADAEPEATPGPTSTDTLPDGTEYDLSHTKDTQVPNTVGTYDKAKDQYFADVDNADILDYGAGMGLASKKHGFASLEPYPTGWTPDFMQADEIDRQYDGIILNNILNVLPSHTRHVVLADAAKRRLAPGGRMYINVRSRTDVMSQERTATRVFSQSEILTQRGTYQKGFQRAELIKYLQRELGKEYTVESAKFGSVAVLVTKKAGKATKEQPVSNRAPTTETVQKGTREIVKQAGSQPSIVELLAMHDDIADAPTEGQMDAGNYAKAHPEYQGLDLALETKPGQERVPGKKSGHFVGDIKGTVGADGDPIDIILNKKNKPNADSPVFIVNAFNPDENGKFDEHKVMIGFGLKSDAKTGYESVYDKEWFGSMHKLTMSEFKLWLEKGNTQVEFDPKAWRGKASVIRKGQHKAGHKQFLDETATKAVNYQGAATNRAQAKLAPDPTKDDLLTYIRKLGGINMDSQSDLPRARFGKKSRAGRWSGLYPDYAPNIVGLPSFNQFGTDDRGNPKGMTISEAAEAAYEADYMPADPETGNYDEGMFVDLMLDAEMDPVYSDQNQSWMEEQDEAYYQEQKDREGDEYADHVEGRKDLEKVNSELARLMGIAGEIDKAAMVEIALQILPDAEIERQLQRIIDEEAQKAPVNSGAESANEADTGNGRVQARAVKRTKKGFPDPADYDYIEDYPWEELIDEDTEILLPQNDIESYDLSPRTYVIDIYNDKNRLDFDRQIFAAMFDKYRAVEDAVRREYGEDTNFRVSRTGGNHYDLDLVHIITEGTRGVPYRELSPIADIQKEAAGGKLKKEAAVQRSKLLHEMGFLTKGEWQGLSAQYSDLLKQGGGVKTWGEEFKKTAPRDYISHAEGKKKIAEWKELARTNFGSKVDNSQKTILSLFDATGEWAQPWIDAGYDVRAIDLKRDDVDIRDIDYEWLVDMGFLDGNVWGILAACPCQKFTNTSARDRLPTEKGGKPRPSKVGGTDFIGETHNSVDLVEDTLALIDFLKPRFWALENPLGRIQDITSTPDGTLSFNPNNFGDPYTKKTVLHGNFNPNLPTANVDPRPDHGGEGSKMQSSMGSSDELNEGLRSVTPEGFAYAFFVANADANYSIHEELANDWLDMTPEVKDPKLKEMVKMGWMLGAQEGMTINYNEAGDYEQHLLGEIGDLPIEVQDAIEDGRGFHNEEDGWKIMDASIVASEQAQMEKDLRSMAELDGMGKNMRGAKNALMDAINEPSAKKWYRVQGASNMDNLQDRYFDADPGPNGAGGYIDNYVDFYNESPVTIPVFADTSRFKVESDINDVTDYMWEDRKADLTAEGYTGIMDAKGTTMVPFDLSSAKAPKNIIKEGEVTLTLSGAAGTLTLSDYSNKAITIERVQAKKPGSRFAEKALLRLVSEADRRGMSLHMQVMPDKKIRADGKVSDYLIATARNLGFEPLRMDGEVYRNDLTYSPRTSGEPVISNALGESAIDSTTPTDGEKGAAMIRQKPKTNLRNEIPGLKSIWGHLTKPEQDKLNRQTAKKLVDIFQTMPDAKEMAAIAYSGRAKKGWYAKSAGAILDVFGAEDAPRFAALLAAMSPQTSVESNLENALRVWHNWTTDGGINRDRDRPTDPNRILQIMAQSVPGNKGLGSVLEAWRNNSIRALTAVDPEVLVISGPKVNSFMMNLRNEVNEVTNDTWMANYAMLDPKVFEGSITQTGRDPGKGPGYMAMVAMVRKAAKIATQRTGELWTPAEIQETIWSWAKTVYTKAESAGENRTVVQLLEAGDLRHEDIADAVDFESLFVQGVYRKILENAGYENEVAQVDRARAGRATTGGRDAETGPATSAEGSGITESSFERHLRRAGKRLDKVRKQRKEKAELKAKSGKPELDEEGGAALIAEPANPIEQARHRRNVTKWLAKSVKRLRNRVPIIVKNHPGELNLGIEIPASAAGFKYDGKVYLFRDNIRDKNEATMAIVHEAIGHLGLEGSLGRKKFNELIGDVMNLRVEIMFDHAAHPEIQALMTELRKYYVDENGNYALDAREEAREILAHIAHSKKRIGPIREIYNKIASWVRTWAAAMGLADPDMAAIEALLVRATDYVMDENRTKFTDKEKGAAMVARTPEDPEPTESASNDEIDVYTALGLGGKETPGLWKKISDLRTGDIKAAVSEATARGYEGLFDGLIEGKRLEKKAGVGLGKETTYMTPDGVRKKTFDYANSFYVAARLATGVSDMMTHLLQYGSLQWNNGIVAEVQGTRGFLDVLGELGKENLNDWLVWMAGNRAEELMAQGRENNLTPDMIVEAKSKNLGKEELFDRIKKEYNEMNRHQLDFAEGGGLIDAAKRAQWESEWYVPFYRQTDEDRTLGPNTKRGLSHQSAGIRRLMGAKVPTADLLENIMTNWIKLTDASVKNHALRTMVDNFKDTDYITNATLEFKKALIPRGEIHKLIKNNNEFAVSLAEWLDLPPGVTADGIWDAVSDLDDAGLESLWQIVAPTDPDIVRVQRGGKNEYWRVHVPGLLRATTHINAQGSNSRGMRAARWFKTILTIGVTTSPDFMMRNFIRDAAHSWAINKDNMWFLKDSFKGLHGAVTEGPVHRAMMAAGASFQGGYVHGTDPEATALIMRRELINAGWKEGRITSFLGSIVDTPAKLSKVTGQAWQHYRNQGDRIENASRVATAQAGIDAGKPTAQWLFESKDLMDYSRRGNFAALIFLTDVMPFLNARIQGMDKLGRAAKEDPKIVVKKMAMIGAFSVMLAMMNDDDDDYQELPDWEKDAYWHLFPPGADGKKTHIRIPKPFEIGFIAGTMPERMYRAWYSKSQPSEKVVWALQHGIRETLNINLYPQIILPLAEIKANRHFYFDQPIETLSDKNVVKSERYNRYTSETAVTLGGTKLAEWLDLSPKELQHLWNGYTGTMGAYALSATDIVTGKALSFPEPEQTQLEDIPLIKSLYKGDRKRTTQWQTDIYDRLKEVNELYGTLRKHIKANQPEKAKDWLTEHQKKLSVRKPLEAAQRLFSKLRMRRDQILSDDNLTAAEKYQKSQAIQLQINAMAKKFETQTRAAFAGR